MSETEIFYKYLVQIKDAYQQSDIKQSNWYYSLSSTPLYKRGIVLCGFNWGVSGRHEPQTTYPTIDFFNINDLGSVKRVRRYVEKFNENIIQINLCFFRSEKEHQISERDLALNKEIFKNLLKELQPKVFIGFSSRIGEVLKDCLVKIEMRNLSNGNKRITITKAQFIEEFGSGKFIYIPHPNYPLKSSARKEAWELLDLHF